MAKFPFGKKKAVTSDEPMGPIGFSILLEDGQRIPASANQARMWRAQGDDGRFYEHVRESPDGEWVYRLVK